jgi:hypothetical protein
MAEQPKRIRLSRRKGYRKPEGAISVARPSKWGNRHRVGPTQGLCGSYCIDRQRAVDLYREDLEIALGFGGGTISPQVVEDLAELRGHDLACWCPLDQPCHADVLLEVANG